MTGWWLAGGLLLGAIVGSFLATVALRWPEGRSALAGRSCCDGCGRTLRAAELVPVLSFLVQRGRCRRCGGRIDRRHLAIELAGALVGGTALLVRPEAAGLLGAGLGWTLLLLAVLDVEHQWLPDRLTLPLAGAGLASAAALPPELADRAIGVAAGFASLWLIAAVYLRARGRHGMGGGDPKLLGAIGAWTGWTALPFILLLASLVGLISAVAARARGEAVSGQTALPFGAMLAVAAYPIWLVMVGSAS